MMDQAEQKRVKDRLTDIEQLMWKDRAAYFRDENLQGEYRRLLDARSEAGKAS